MNPQAAFSENLETIDRIIAAICRRHLLVGDDKDDLDSYVKLRLIDDEYAAFRKFQGRSSLNTYLTVVITNYFRDFRTSRWGRWRPSAEAKRLGPLALKLEILMYRDGHPIRAAIEILRSRGVDLPGDPELMKLAARIPARSNTREVPSFEAENTAGPDSADAGVIEAELDHGRTKAVREVERALQTLPQEDQLILRMRFLDGKSVADIARLLKIQQKPLYRRIENNLQRLRVLLEQQGIGRELVAGLLV